MLRVHAFVVCLIFNHISTAVIHTEEKYVVEGEDIVLKCNYDKCRWSNAFGTLFNDNQYEISDNECKLKIKSCSFAMNGWKFICSKSNKESRAVLVNVLVTPDIYFEDSNGNNSLGQEIVLRHDAEDIILKCVAKNGFPEAFIQCQDDDKNISSTSNESTNEKGLHDVVNSFQIKFESPDQFVKNINCKIQHSSFQIPKEVSLVIRKEYATRKVSLNVTKMEDKYKLICFADGYPIPDTMVIKIDKPNPSRVPNAEIALDEFGTYYCLARNKLNEHQIQSEKVLISDQSIITEEELTATDTNEENVQAKLSPNSALSPIQRNIFVIVITNTIAFFIMKNL